MRACWVFLFIFFSILSTALFADDFSLLDMSGRSIDFFSLDNANDTANPKEDKRKLMFVLIDERSFVKKDSQIVNAYFQKMNSSNLYRVFFIATFAKEKKTLFSQVADANVLYDDSLIFSLTYELKKTLDYRIFEPKSMELSEKGNLQSLSQESQVFKLMGEGLRIGTKDLIIPNIKKMSFKSTILPAVNKSCLNCHAKLESDIFESVSSIRNWRASLLNEIRRGYMPGGFYAQKNHPLAGSVDEKSLRVATAWFYKDATATLDEEAFYKKFYKDKKEEETHLLKSLGTPDLIIEASEEVIITAEGSPFNKTFSFKMNLKEDQFIDAVYASFNSSTCHHLRLYSSQKPLVKRGIYNINPDAKFIATEAMTDKGGAPAFVTERSYQVAEVSRLKGFLPKYPCLKNNRCLYSSLGKSDYLTLEAHYLPTGQLEKDRPRLQIYFKKKKEHAVKMEKIGLFLSPEHFTILPHETKTVSMEYRFEKSVDLVGFNLHAHLRARSVRLLLKKKGAKVFIPVFTAPRFQYRMQRYAFLQKPIVLQKGDLIKSEVFYDNSSNNPGVPNPLDLVTYGEDVIHQESHFVTLFYSDRR